jgi:hypothetical protein
MRFDGFRYCDCRWCGGQGCLYCEAEADKAYKAAFPDGPKPIATFDMTTPTGVETARKAIGRDAIVKAFGPDGGGVAEIIANCAGSKP